MDKLIPMWVLWVLAILTSSCHAQTQRNAQSQPPLFTPAPGSPINIGSRPNDIAVADLNKDGRLDIVTCNDGETLTVLLGNGRGGFTPAPGSPIKAAAHLVAVGDVNNDRNPDLALTHHDSFGVVVLLGAGDGRFSPAAGSPFTAHQGVKAHNHGLALSDLNSDRHGRRSTLVTSQLPIAHWHAYLGDDPTVADALLDRLLSTAHRLELKGESMRKREKS
jgi:hypothetical protein